MQRPVTRTSWPTRTEGPITSATVIAPPAAACAPDAVCGGPCGAFCESRGARRVLSPAVLAPLEALAAGGTGLGTAVALPAESAGVPPGADEGGAGDDGTEAVSSRAGWRPHAATISAA